MFLNKINYLSQQSRLSFLTKSILLQNKIILIAKKIDFVIIYFFNKIDFIFHQHDLNGQLK